MPSLCRPPRPSGHLPSKSHPARITSCRWSAPRRTTSTRPWPIFRRRRATSSSHRIRPTIELMDAHHILTTTRAVRKRLDFDRPVSREILLECLEVAVQAPTGSNSQGWQWVIVTDPDKKRVIGELYRKSWYLYASSGRPRYKEDDPRHHQLPRVASS